MQGEINQANGVKSEILTDFDKIKQKVENAQRWEEECKKLKKKADTACNLFNSVHQKHNKLSIQAYNSLHNIKFKF